MNQITTVGVDLAKAVIVVCAADAEGRALFFKQLSLTALGNGPQRCHRERSAWKPAARRITGGVG